MKPHLSAPEPSASGLERMRAAALLELASEPVPRPWWKDALLLAGINAVAAVLCTLALGREVRVLNTLALPMLLAVATPIVLSLLLAAVAAVVPGAHRARWAVAVLLAVAGVAVIVGGNGLDEGRALLAAGMPCFNAEVIMSVVPTAAAVGVLSRFAFNPARMFIAGLGAGAAGLFALHLHCPIGTWVHLALFHVLPWLAAAGAAVWIRARIRSRSFAP